MNRRQPNSSLPPPTTETDPPTHHISARFATARADAEPSPLRQVDAGQLDTVDSRPVGSDWHSGPRGPSHPGYRLWPAPYLFDRRDALQAEPSSSTEPECLMTISVQGGILALPATASSVATCAGEWLTAARRPAARGVARPGTTTVSMKSRVGLLLVLGLFTAVDRLAAQAPAASSAAAMADSLDSYFTGASAFGFSGAVLLAEKGEVLLEKGYGLGDRAAGLPLTADSPLHIGSLGKQFTAAAVLRLEADGILSTGDRLDRFFPDAPEDKRAITLDQLLSHTSGLPYLTARSFMEVRPRDAIMAEMLDLPLEFGPGERYGYSNPGYALLAGVIERASGDTFENYLEQALFRRAGLTRTGFVNDTDRWTDAGVRNYSGPDDEGTPLSAMRPMPKAVGAGSIVSTVGDLYRWDRALQGDGVLPESARLRLFAPAVSIQEGQHYGYGWMITRTGRGETLIHHAGDLAGYNSDLRRYAEPDLVLIVASNARIDGRGYRTVATNALAYLLNDRELDMPPTVRSAPPASLPALAGVYDVGSGSRIHVSARADGLSIGGTGDPVLAALAGTTESAAAERSTTLSLRAAAVATALATHDAGPLREHLHPSLSFENTRQWLVASMTELADSLGAFRGIQDLGTAIISATAARSYFHLLFERGSYPVVYGWNGERIISFDAEYTVPMETVFLPTGEATFAHHDLFTGRTLEARFEPGVRRTLTIAGAGASVTGVQASPEAAAVRVVGPGDRVCGVQAIGVCHETDRHQETLHLPPPARAVAVRLRESAGWKTRGWCAVHRGAGPVLR
jgi:CubicO group peptidase (beta-lactamase class C family)